MYERHDRYWYQVKYRYGVTKKQVLKALEKQNGKCGICGRVDRGMHIDHDHATDEFRGLLCHHCNRGLGYLGDSIEGLERALTYLKRGRERTRT
jgi:hypothetical protein